MSNERYEWQGKRMFNWYSKEARIIRAYLILSAIYERLDEEFHKAINLRDEHRDDGVEVEISVAFLERMHRFKAAGCRLRDRLGCSNIAASDAFFEKHPHLPGESDVDYYARMGEEKAK